MTTAMQFTRTAHAHTESPTFREVVAYLHGVADAIQTVERSVKPAWPTSLDVPCIELDKRGLESEPRTSGRLTLRFGEVAFELEGTLCFARTAAPLVDDSTRGGSRNIDFDDTVRVRDTPFPMGRCTLPYWSPAVSLVPAQGIPTVRPTGDESKERPSLVYSALALSLVPIASPMTSQWPDAADERVSSIRLRCAPLSPELYALTGTDGLWDT